MKTFWNSTLTTMALRNSLGHWRYSLSSIIIIGVGFLSIWMFRGYMHGVATMYQDHFAVRSMFGDILIEKKDAATSYDGRGIDRVQQETLAKFLRMERDSIQNVNRFLRVDGQIAVGSRTSIFEGLAYDIVEGESIRGDKWGWNAVAGRPLKSSDEIIIGRALARLLDCDFDSNNYLQRLGSGPAYIVKERPFTCGPGYGLVSVATESGRVNANDFKIAGIMDVGFRDLDRHWLMMDLSVGQSFMDTSDVSWISIEAGEQQEAVFQRFLKFIETEGLSLEATRLGDHRFTDLYRRSMTVLGIFESFALSILCGIVGISVFNLMVKIVNERRREIGLFRSLGYGSGTIVRLFITEAAITSLLGLTLGTGATYLTTDIVNRLGIVYKAGILSEPVPFFVALPLAIGLSTAIFLLVISLAASYSAIHRAVSKSITECLLS